MKKIDRLREAFRLVKRRHPFHIDAIVVLPDHLHAIWRLPPGDSNYPLRWSLIKRFFSSGSSAGPRTTSQRSKREKGIWQRRYWEHCIRDENDLRRHLDYIRGFNSNVINLSPPYSPYEQISR